MRNGWVLAFLGVSACSLLTDLGSLQQRPDDAGPSDGMMVIDAPVDGFALTLSPVHLTMDPGDSFPVTVTITRGSAFNGAVKIDVNGRPTQLDASTLTVAPNMASAPFTLTLTAAPPQTDFILDVLGSSFDGTKTSSAKLGIHAGSLLAAAMMDAAVVVPAFATSIIVKAWGAGGGGSDGGPDGTGNIFSGAQGGGGGFATGVITVTPNEMLALQVGGGGPISAGGGYSGVFRGATPLVIAGGGGGASHWWQNEQSGFCAQGGTNGRGGAAGGGDTGQVLAGAAAPGTSTAGGAAGLLASAGGALQGGNGGKVGGPMGGKHGGGSAGLGSFCGSGSGGGGGGGWFGGGGGDFRTGSVGNGGGGGSGYVEATAKQPLLTAGKNAAVGNGADPDCTMGVGGGGAAGYEDCNPTCVNVKPTPGGGGRIVARLPKP